MKDFIFLVSYSHKKTQKAFCFSITVVCNVHYLIWTLSLFVGRSYCRKRRRWVWWEPEREKERGMVGQCAAQQTVNQQGLETLSHTKIWSHTDWTNNRLRESSFLMKTQLESASMCVSLTIINIKRCDSKLWRTRNATKIKQTNKITIF